MRVALLVLSAVAMLTLCWMVGDALDTRLRGLPQIVKAVLGVFCGAYLGRTWRVWARHELRLGF